MGDTQEPEDNAAIDAENAAIDAENKAIDEENKSIDKENADVDAENKAPEAPQDEEGRKPMPDILEIDAKAVLVWVNPEGEESEETYYRSLAALARYVYEKLNADRELEKHRLTVKLRVREGTEGNVSEKDAILSEGTVPEVVADLARRALSPIKAMSQLQITAMTLADLSMLKGIIITAVFEDAKAAGFGVISDSNEVTDEDIKVLGEAAANQVELFKAEMRKDKKIDFPGDSPIIVPGGMLGTPAGQQAIRTK